MGKFMKKAVLEGANSAYKIAKLNVLDSATHVAPSEVDWIQGLWCQIQT